MEEKRLLSKDEVYFLVFFSNFFILLFLLELFSHEMQIHNGGFAPF